MYHVFYTEVSEWFVPQEQKPWDQTALIALTTEQLSDNNRLILKREIK